MRARVALAGELPQNPELFKTIAKLTEEIGGCLCGEEENIRMQMLVSPSYTGDGWMAWNGEYEYPLFTYHMKNKSDYVPVSEQTLSMDTPLRNLVGEAMCDKADAAIVVWNEDVTELAGATWEFLKIAYGRRIPCLWISTKSLQTYCLWDSYYKGYEKEYLTERLLPLSDAEIQPSISRGEKKTILLSYWQKRYRAFLTKYKAEQIIHESEQDKLMDTAFEMEEGTGQGENVRQLLLEKFGCFDKAAIEVNSRFQSMIYQRSVLPFITTIFLAIGFYAETLLGKSLSAAIPDYKDLFLKTAALLAGTGFLVHGFMNFYVYRLSRSARIGEWQKEFVTNRFMAEALRVLIHFLPYGISLNLRKLCSENLAMHRMLNHLADDAEPEKQELDRGTFLLILKHLKEMLEDQLDYHKNSIKRYQSIVDTLEKWGKRMFYIGFILVLCRGGMQFVIVVRSLFDEANVAVDITRSFLNMLALLLPAWAAYFTTKATQNNFIYNLNNHQKMEKKLEEVKNKVTDTIEMEEIPMEAVTIMLEEIAENMLVEDTFEWHIQYIHSTVKPL